MDIVTFNYLEAGLWFVLALVLVLFGRQTQGKVLVGRVFNLLVLTFIVFGISDVIEAETGAWWQPVELLLLKVGCVCSFFYCFVRLWQKSHM